MPALTATDLQPILDAITSYAGVIVPVGVSALAIFVGIRAIPRLVHMFF